MTRSWWHRRGNTLAAYSAEVDAESTRRIALALSLLNHRPPSPRTAELALRALQGASVERLLVLDQENCRMIRIEASRLGVGIPADMLARLNHGPGPDTPRWRDLYLQMAMHVVAENIIDLTVRPDEVKALGWPSDQGYADAEAMVKLGVLDRTEKGYTLAGVDVYARPQPGPRRNRVAVILGYASGQAKPFSAKDIADLLGVTVAVAANYLGRLSREGLLDRVSRGRYAAPTTTVDGRPPPPETSDESASGAPNKHTRFRLEPGEPSRARATKDQTHLEIKDQLLTTTTNTKATTTTNNLTATDFKSLTTKPFVADRNKHTQSNPRSARRIPQPFPIDATMREWAKARVPQLDIDAATEDFVDYWASKPNNATKLDWTRTWQMWMRKEARSHSPSAPYLPRPSEAKWRAPECPPDMDLYGDEYAELKRQSKAAWIEARTGIKLAHR